MDQSWLTTNNRLTSRAFIAKCTGFIAGLAAICLAVVLILAHPYALFFGMIEHHRIHHHPNLIDYGIMLIISSGMMMVIFPIIDVALAGISAAFAAERRILREKLEPFR